MTLCKYHGRFKHLNDQKKQKIQSVAAKQASIVS